MFGLTDKVGEFAAVIVGVLLALALATRIKLHDARVQVGTLQAQVSQLNKDNGTLRANNAQLQAAVDEQNKAVADAAAAASTAQAAAQVALSNAAKANMDRAVALGRLQHAHASTCTEAMPYIRQLLEGERQ
jgi:outer membrane murein-binding lipoprotein Lpp